jgi:hypothetical protein
MDVGPSDTKMFRQVSKTRVGSESMTPTRTNFTIGIISIRHVYADARSHVQINLLLSRLSVRVTLYFLASRSADLSIHQFNPVSTCCGLPHS